MSPLATLLWAKARISRHTLASVRHESKLKVAFVFVSTVLLWVGIFELARFGFGLLEVFGAELLGAGRLSLSDLVMSRLLSVFALVLFVMLIFSNLLIAFQTFFRAKEMAFLVQSPISTTDLFLGRFYECVTFSSWASAFLGSPVLLAYGLESGASPLFYLSLIPFYLPYVAIPAALGTLATLLLVRIFGRLRRGPWTFFGAAALVGLFFYFRRSIRIPDLSSSADLHALVEALGSTQSAFLPSHWAASGVLAAAGGNFSEALFQLALLLANALLLVYLGTRVAERFFHTAWTGLQGGGDGPEPDRSRGLLGPKLERALRFLGEPDRSLVIKDLRLFWRDSAQWSQFVIFFGVMALYLANLRGPGANQGLWSGWGTLLNLGASMLVLASLTTRFVFPLISLEGKRFWILGLAPVSRRRIVWQKFWLSVTTTSVFTLTVALLSATQLELDGLAFALSLGGVAATTVALSGLAVGLGSLYPNFQEDHPARVVSGMGGTLNFLLSMIYVLLVLAAQAVVLLWDRLGESFGDKSFPWVVAGASAWILGLTLLTCGLPMRLGIRHLERTEI